MELCIHVTEFKTFYILDWVINPVIIEIFTVCVNKISSIARVRIVFRVNVFIIMLNIILGKVASWRKRLDARLPPLGSRVRVSVTPCGFCGGQNGVWVGFSRGFCRFPLPQISFHHFSTFISSISFHFISPCDGASGMVGRHPCYSRT